MTNREKLIEIIADHIGITPSEVLTNSTFEQIGCDSLDEIELIMLIEEEFEITIPEELVRNNRKIGEALDEIERIITP